MTVKQLIEELSKLNPEIRVLGEFDSDGDEFMVKSGVAEVYVGDVNDDVWYDEDDDNDYCIIKLGKY